MHRVTQSVSVIYVSVSSFNFSLLFLWRHVFLLSSQHRNDNFEVLHCKLLHLILCEYCFYVGHSHTDKHTDVGKWTLTLRASDVVQHSRRCSRCSDIGSRNVASFSVDVATHDVAPQDSTFSGRQLWILVESKCGRVYARRTVVAQKAHVSIHLADFMCFAFAVRRRHAAYVCVPLQTIDCNSHHRSVTSVTFFACHFCRAYTQNTKLIRLDLIPSCSLLFRCACFCLVAADHIFRSFGSVTSCMCFLCCLRRPKVAFPFLFLIHDFSHCSTAEPSENWSSGLHRTQNDR